jgi:hypothetical protein
VQKGFEEGVALALACSAHPECRTFMSELVQKMVGGDEKMWRALLERAGNNLNEMPVRGWNDEAETCLEHLMFLLYDCRMSPRDILSPITGVWPLPEAV